MRVEIEEGHLSTLRRLIEEMYQARPTGCGGSFGELLCYEIHTVDRGGGRKGRTFVELAAYWGITVTTLGELIWDHCRRMEALPKFTDGGG